MSLVELFPRIEAATVSISGQHTEKQMEMARSAGNLVEALQGRNRHIPVDEASAGLTNRPFADPAGEGRP
ncbi:hypothetical protein [Caulobacter sp. UNC358MFTsu5.1]|uniref:hypothetical protein n=1 Tax=Caulobacter sp. UNC358MFTsu5.1 TaxID=1449049 RepID=UPI0012DD58C8|nr:hypothetical protein [Caulobacter sp. UNC358MFTsu5.1]